ncbi:RusA family crossover junction endodeoxyribonuclease [Mesorhizobium sp.]|uniref:RusA family crossover junction endodeoxyribonuclease n=1 Tax=Mesorhizobium sp. TaxID=1871066 RepID=UPI00257FE5C2|nr:RusA family crossover junction endodeoxyribonuclease [Mesorhizobium sp.]
MFGDWQHRFESAPVSYAAGGANRAEFRTAIQAALKNKFFYTNEVRLDIVLYLDLQTVLETDETADVDNYAKAVLDGLKGPHGILFDDTQVQALTIHWLDSYGRDRTYFEVSISSSPDDFMLKPVEFYEMPDGLWYPHGRRVRSNGGQEDLSDRNHYAGLLILETMASVKRDARHLFRRGGMDRLRAYQRGMHLSSSARGFHRSRIDAGFSMHPRREWRAACEAWRADHAEDVGEIERIVGEVRENYGKMAAILAGQLPSGEDLGAEDRPLSMNYDRT